MKEANQSVWNETMGRTNKESSLVYKVATVQTASSHLKEFGKLTNSLPIIAVDAEGRLLDEEEGDAGAVRMCVSAYPNNIRVFIKSLELGGAQVVEEWKEAMAKVSAFDYKSSSLQGYALLSGLHVKGASAGKGGAQSSKRKNREAREENDEEEEGGDRLLTNEQVCAKLQAKGRLHEPAACRAMKRLSAFLREHANTGADFEGLSLSGGNYLWFRVMDVILDGAGKGLPSWICARSNRSAFEQLGTIRSTEMARSPLGWSKSEQKKAMENWKVLSDPADANAKKVTVEVSESEGEEDEQPSAKRPKAVRLRSSGSSTTLPRKGTNDEKDSNDRKDKVGETLQQIIAQMKKLEVGLDKLNSSSAAHTSAIQQLPANTSSSEQDSASDKRLLVAMNALNHLVQDFHEANKMKCASMLGMVNILRNDFTHEEIKAILKRTGVDEYMY